MSYYIKCLSLSVFKMNEIMPLAATWMDLRMIILMWSQFHSFRSYMVWYLSAPSATCLNPLSTLCVHHAEPLHPLGAPCWHMHCIFAPSATPAWSTLCNLVYWVIIYQILMAHFLNLFIIEVFPAILPNNTLYRTSPRTSFTQSHYTCLYL